VTKLSDFEGLAVTQSSIEIPGAAGGFRDALKVDAVELHKGDVIYAVLECEVQKIRHDSLDKEDLTGPQERVHILRVTNATLVDKALVGDALSAQADRIAAAKELEGQTKMPTSPPWLGYDDLSANDVAERLDEADFDLLDLTEAYERANGGRKGVLKAIESARAVLESKL
jgi:hypothetical protein